MKNYFIYPRYIYLHLLNKNIVYIIVIYWESGEFYSILFYFYSLCISPPKDDCDTEALGFYSEFYGITHGDFRTLV